MRIMTLPDALLADFLPEGVGPGAAVALLILSFVGSALTAALSVGGGLLLLVAMAAILPVAAVIPVHGVIQVGSNLGRAMAFRRAVDLRALAAFSVGALLGTLIGAGVGLDPRPGMLEVGVAAFVLFLQWGPKVRLPLGPRGLAAAGAISGGLGLFVGAAGPFTAAVLAKMPGYDRARLIGTSAVCMTVLHLLKVATFGFVGFAFGPFVPLIVGALIAGGLGTMLGARLLQHLPEALFRQGLRVVLTGLSLYLLYQGLPKLFAPTG